MRFPLTTDFDHYFESIFDHWFRPLLGPLLYSAARAEPTPLPFARRRAARPSHVLTVGDSSGGEETGAAAGVGPLFTMKNRQPKPPFGARQRLNPRESLGSDSRKGVFERKPSTLLRGLEVQLRLGIDGDAVPCAPPTGDRGPGRWLSP